MNCLLMGEPTVFSGRESVLIDVSEPAQKERDMVDFVGAYPVYASEREFIHKNGIQSFWGLGLDRLDPLRSPAV
jgi:hypothetical protein